MILLSQLLWMWLYGLISLALLVFAALLLYGSWRKRERRVVVRTKDGQHQSVDSVAVVKEGRMRSLLPRRAAIALAVFVLAWSFFGRHLILLFYPSEASAAAVASSTSTNTIVGPDGTKLHVEVNGPPNAPALILTHGWSLDTREWNYAKRDLSPRFRLITWDLPGLGRSTERRDRDYSLDKMAGDLGAVVQFARSPVILVGHSIGGMINLTYCRRYPEQLGRDVVGLVQIDTTYTDPVKTTSSPGFDTAMETPVYKPLLHFTIVASPLVRIMNWFSYENGLAHVMNASSSFTGSETREQLDYAARRTYEASPAVLARGMLGMFAWDATNVLPAITVKTLILQGQQDKTTTPTAGAYMRQTVPRAEMKTIDRAAHLGVLEQNAVYNAATMEFAQSCYNSITRRPGH